MTTQNGSTGARVGFQAPLPEWRNELYEELHARPFPFLQSPAQVSQLACRHEVRGEELEHLRVLCEGFDVSGPEDGASCFYVREGAFELRWEMHTEFSTYTFIRHEEEASPFEVKAIDLLPLNWLENIPGEIVSASHVSVMPMPESLDSLDVMRQSFSDQRLIGSKVGSDQAQIWTSFLSQDDGFSRFLIYNRSLNKCETGRLVQRVLEIETYRLFSLLALPLSKLAHPEINAIDDQLCDAVKEIPDMDSHGDEKALLERLTAFSARIESLRAGINYRASASAAYSELVKKRVFELDEVSHPGLQTLGDFLERRFTPAVRTIVSVSKRLDDLSTRIDRATDLIRTKVDLEIENQNQKLLASLDERGRRQYLLQRTVEGLSVVAISYYLVELIKITIPGARWLGLEVEVDDVAVFTVPMILGLVIVVSRFIRRKWD